DGAVAIADLDRDGDQDVLYGAMPVGSEWGVGVFANQGGGQLAPAAAWPTGLSFGPVYDLAVADVTGDGWPDILGTGQASEYGYVLLASDGTGGFAAPRAFRSGEMARAIVAADLDADGDLDVLVVNSGSLTITVHENAGGFALPDQVVVPTLSDHSDVGDVDGDGDLDLVTASSVSITLLRNQGGGSFTAVPALSPGRTISSVRLRDVTSDGILDLLFLRRVLAQPYQVVVAAGDGTGGFGPPQAFPIGGTANALDTLDADGDGDLDVVVAGGSGSSAGLTT